MILTMSLLKFVSILILNVASIATTCMYTPHDVLYRNVGTYADSILGPCHFINGSKRAAVALASFPGSGNTWVRGLLEKATGVCTGE